MREYNRMGSGLWGKNDAPRNAGNEGMFADAPMARVGCVLLLGYSSNVYVQSWKQTSNGQP